MAKQRLNSEMDFQSLDILKIRDNLQSIVINLLRIKKCQEIKKNLYKRSLDFLRKELKPIESKGIIEKVLGSIQNDLLTTTFLQLYLSSENKKEFVIDQIFTVDEVLDDTFYND